MTTAMKKVNGKAGGPTGEDLAKQIETLQKDLNSLTKTMTEMGKAKGDAAVSATREKLSDARHHMSDVAETARLHAMEMQGQANDFISKQPATALGVAAGLGFLVGMMTSRK